MISSAVVIPEQELEHQSLSPSLKRRPSSTSSDSHKRPKLDTPPDSDNGILHGDGGAMSPPHRRRPVLGAGAVEEKKRSKRLFGALLGTLSQPSSKPAHRRRDEIEQRQKERLRKDAEAREEERRRKREELDQARRLEQRVWDRESMRIRHRNMRAMAGFLWTKTEPKLYYKPWELREEEEQQIRQQVKAVEQDIKREIDETSNFGESDDEDRHRQDGRDRVSMEHIASNPRSRNAKADSNSRDSDIGGEDVQPSPSDGTEVKPTNIDNASNADDTLPAGSKVVEEDRPKDDEHAGEELVEGQEDDVIY